MLDGKRVYCFGDSIMAADSKIFSYTADFNREEIGTECCGYPTLLAQETGVVIVNNFAVGGQGISGQKDIILQQSFSNIDIVIISVGVNDFSSGKVIGKIPSSTEEQHDNTFIGEYCTALDYICKSNPLVKILLMTPLHRNTLHREGKGPVNTIDTCIHGNILKDYADAVKDIGEFYGCPIADMYSESGLNRFNLPLLTFEGVHPTNVGYKFIITPLIQSIKKLY